jgi:hypothetical protein
MPYIPLAPPPMFGHLCLVPVWPGAAEPADGDEVADGLDRAVPVWAVVEALAMVRPRARVAPSAPAPMAVPMSGRVILTCFSFGLVPVRISRPGGTGRQLGGASQPGMSRPDVASPG